MLPTKVSFPAVRITAARSSSSRRIAWPSIVLVACSTFRLIPMLFLPASLRPGYVGYHGGDSACRDRIPLPRYVVESDSNARGEHADVRDSLHYVGTRHPGALWPCLL